VLERRGEWSAQRLEAVTLKLKRAGYVGKQRFPVIKSAVKQYLEHSESDDEFEAKFVKEELAVPQGLKSPSYKSQRRGVMMRALDSSDESEPDEPRSGSHHFGSPPYKY
jgi:hypothetical protein